MSTFAQAYNDEAAAEAEKTKFCNENLFTKLANYQNRMAFTNQGGLQNGGVCWWHSRFQRNANSLAVFLPNEPRPRDVKYLVEELKRGNRVVEIPGYRNLKEFSAIHYRLIQKELEQWQKKDGFLRFRWIRGLRGYYNVTPDSLKFIMDNIYEEFTTSNAIMYQKLQMKGVTSHAWLLIDMIKNENGYTMTVVDSNFTIPRSFTYREGDTSLMYPGSYGRFVPYTEQRNEWGDLERARDYYCQDYMMSSEVE